MSKNKNMAHLWDNDPRLDQLNLVLQSENNWFNKKETEFVNLSLKQRERKRFKRRREIIAAFGILSLLLIASIVAAVIAVNQSFLAEKKTSEAQKQADIAKIKTKQALTAQKRAEISDEKAKAERDNAIKQEKNALTQTAISQREAIRAENAEKETTEKLNLLLRSNNAIFTQNLPLVKQDIYIGQMELALQRLVEISTLQVQQEELAKVFGDIAFIYIQIEQPEIAKKVLTESLVLVSPAKAIKIRRLLPGEEMNTNPSVPLKEAIRQLTNQDYLEILEKRFAFPEMVKVEGGKFEMGTASDSIVLEESLGKFVKNPVPKDEKPAHTVILRDYEIGKYELRLGQFIPYLVANKLLINELYGVDEEAGRACSFENYDKPITCIKWITVLQYCNWLSTLRGKTPCYTIPENEEDSEVTCNFEADGYRLPSEAEWEFAARGGKYSKGTLFSGSNTLHEVAWYSGESIGDIQNIGLKKANELGLYDMSGNVYEFCWDIYDQNYYKTLSGKESYKPSGPIPSQNLTDRVIRGGAFDEAKNSCRVSSRHSAFATAYDFRLGFRVSRTKK